MVVIAKSFAKHVMVTGVKHVKNVMAKERFIAHIALDEVKKSVVYVKGVGYNLMD